MKKKVKKVRSPKLKFPKDAALGAAAFGFNTGVSEPKDGWHVDLDFAYLNAEGCRVLAEWLFLAAVYLECKSRK